MRPPGHTAHTLRIVAMAAAGHEAPSIAAKLGCSLNSVRSAITRARRRGDLPTVRTYSQRGSGQRRWLELRVADMAALQADADARSLTPPALAARLLRTIARDNLVNAVLGDE